MPDDTLKVATFNANSIRSRLALILDWLRREAPDVLCVQETKVQDPDFPVTAFTEAGWHVAFRGQKAHAGVAIISREEPAEVASGFDAGTSTSSAPGEPDHPRLLRAVIRGVPVVNTYVPQGRSPDSEYFQYKLAWFGRLRELFEREYAPDRPLIWVGDFNVAPDPIDVYDPVKLDGQVDYHPAARAALAGVKAWGFVDVFRVHHPEPEQYSYYDYRIPNAVQRKMGWRIDHIWATAALAERSTAAWIDLAARLAEKPSDHTFVVAEFHMDTRP